MNDELRYMKEHVNRRLYRWKENADSSSTKADLANLRRAVGRKPGEAPQIWHVLFEGCNEEIFSDYGTPSWGEWSIQIALTMYAMHQQGKDIKSECMNVEGYTLGRAVARLIEGDSNKESVRNRFNVFATSSNIQECGWHLKSLVQLLRAKGIPLDYVRLSEDLYRFQGIDGAQKVRLAWGQDFYRELNHKNKSEENKDE